MDSALTLYSYFTNDVIQDINPLMLVNHILQAFFFSAAICHLVAVVLKMVHFVYA